MWSSRRGVSEHYQDMMRFLISLSAGPITSDGGTCDWVSRSWQWLKAVSVSLSEDNPVVQWMYGHPVVSLGLVLGVLAALTGAARRR